MTRGFLVSKLIPTWLNKSIIFLFLLSLVMVSPVTTLSSSFFSPPSDVGVSTSIVLVDPTYVAFLVLKDLSASILISPIIISLLNE